MPRKKIESTENSSFPMDSSSITVYHDSNVEVVQPKIIPDGYTKDFGYAFYCTKDEKQAKRRAFSKSSRSGQPIVGQYEFSTDKDLKTLTFDEMTDEWLDFVVKCRKGDKHSYDVVEGPMADDKIYNYIEDFSNGKITRSAFWELVKFDYPTHQIALCTEKALSAIRFVASKTYRYERPEKTRQKGTQIQR